MSHYDGLVQSIDLSQDTLRYSVTGRIWFATIGNVHIQVPESVYNHLLVAYLASQGVTRKTYLELFVPVEQEWK